MLLWMSRLNFNEEMTTMRMFHRTFSRILVAATLTAGVVSGFSGCGSSSNDQGSAVTFLGFFSDLPSGDTIPTGTAWISTRLSSTFVNTAW